MARSAGAVAVLGAILLLLVGCIGAPEGGVPGLFAPPAASTGGVATDSLYYYVFLVAVGVFLIVEGLLLWIVFRYRRRPNAEGLPPQTHGSNLLEVLWTLIPAAIVTMLFVATVHTLTIVEDFAAEPEGVIIDVTGFQWQWTFEYPEEDLPPFTGAGNVGPVLAIPVNERVRIRLHATDVIHSFYVPMFRYKQDVIPGRPNEFDLVVEQPGTYTGQCAEFCGLLHYEMFFTVEAMSRAEYDAWVVEQREAAEPAPPPDGEGHTITLASPDSFSFDPESLTAPADTPIIFDFRNVDLEQPHNVSIVDAEGPGEDWHGMPLAQPGEDLTYVSPPLPAGEYDFYCRVHPLTMRGTLTVGP
jgi:cytochrome c oxidase subunit II